MAQAENCPNCGAEVVFRSPALPAVICGYCQSTVKRIAEGVEKVGEVAVLPFDVSPVQIGTRGEYGGKRFEVIGRIRLGWEAGAWNDWLCLFDDNSHGWLSESDGQFQMVIERPLDRRAKLLKKLADGGAAEVGERVQIDGAQFTVAEARWATCIAAEGELPFAPETGWRVYNVDMRDGDGFAANFEREEGEEPALYVGRYLELAELKPQNLRRIHGWEMPDYAA